MQTTVHKKHKYIHKYKNKIGYGVNGKNAISCACINDIKELLSSNFLLNDKKTELIEYNSNGFNQNNYLVIGNTLIDTQPCVTNFGCVLDVGLVMSGYAARMWKSTYCYCCLPTSMTLASAGSPMFPLVVHQPTSPSIWPAMQSRRRGLSTSPEVTMWCICGCS